MLSMSFLLLKHVLIAETQLGIILPLGKNLGWLQLMPHRLFLLLMFNFMGVEVNQITPG